MSKKITALTDQKSAEIKKLPNQKQGLAFLLLSSFKTPVLNLRGYILRVKDHETRPTAFISLDDREENDFSLIEKIEASDTQDVLDAMAMARRTTFDETTEQVLSVARTSVNKLANMVGCCERSVKYKKKQLMEEYSGAVPQISLFQPVIEEVLE